MTRQASEAWGMLMGEADRRVEEQLEINALSLEYKREFGTAFGNLDVTNLINNPAANGKCRILALHLQEQAFRHAL